MPLPPELEKLLSRESLLLLVKGETGTGKTTAALELMARLQSAGDTVHLSTRTYPDKLVYQHALFSKDRNARIGRSQRLFDQLLTAHVQLELDVVLGGGIDLLRRPKISAH